VRERLFTPVATQRTLESNSCLLPNTVFYPPQPSIDDEIYTEFRKEFPDMRVDVFDEDWSKSPEGKEKWRAFLSRYDDSKLREHNTGTLMRIDVSKPFTPENVCLGM